jgi:hypothetical protein
MKTLTLLTVLFFFALSCGAQIDEDKALYMQKFEKYRRMKNTGQLLTFGGSAAMVIGIVMISNAAETSYSSSGQPTSTGGNVGSGVAVYLLGGCAVGAGIPLWIVGGINKGRYERKLKTVSMAFNSSPQNRGLAIRYKF